MNGVRKDPKMDMIKAENFNPLASTLSTGRKLMVFLFPLPEKGFQSYHTRDQVTDRQKPGHLPGFLGEPVKNERD
jgi:hypothetical protein